MSVLPRRKFVKFAKCLEGIGDTINMGFVYFILMLLLCQYDIV